MPFGKVLGPVLAVYLRSTLTTVLGELRDHAETGEISAKKAKMPAKAGG